jgi:hypothetical protein
VGDQFAIMETVVSLAVLLKNFEYQVRGGSTVLLCAFVRACQCVCVYASVCVHVSVCVR